MSRSALLLGVAAPALGAFPGTQPGRERSASTRRTTPTSTAASPTTSRGRPAPTSSTSSTSASASRPTARRPRRSTTTRSTRTSSAYSAQNTLAGRIPLGQVPGVSADRAWKYSTGARERAGRDPRHRHPLEQRRPAQEGRAEPRRAAAAAERLGTCAQYDCNGDGAFNVDDYAQRPARVGHDRERRRARRGRVPRRQRPDRRVQRRRATTTATATSTTSRAGTSSTTTTTPTTPPATRAPTTTAPGAPRRRARRATRATAASACAPTCQIVPMRVWDTFVVDTNNFAQAVLYAADNDIEVVEGASGALFNSRFARQAFEYAYRAGRLLRDRLVGPEHGRPQHPDALRRGDAGAGHRRRRARARAGTRRQQFIDFFNDLGVPLGHERARSGPGSATPARRSTAATRTS